MIVPYRGELMNDKLFERIRDCRTLLIRVVRLRSVIRGQLFHSSGKIHNGYSSGKRNSTPQTFQRNLTILRRCLYREKQLMAVVERSFPGAMSDLAQCVCEADMENIPVKEKQANRRLLRAFRLLWNSTDFIYKRMLLQEEFVEKEDFDSFYRFLRYLNKRSRLDSKIMELVVYRSGWEVFKEKTGYLKRKNIINMGWASLLWIIISFTVGDNLPFTLPMKILCQIMMFLVIFVVSSHTYVHIISREKYDYYNRKRFEKLLY